MGLPPGEEAPRGGAGWYRVACRQKLQIRERPDPAARALGLCSEGEVIELAELQGNWARLAGEELRARGLPPDAEAWVDSRCRRLEPYRPLDALLPPGLRGAGAAAGAGAEPAEEVQLVCLLASHLASEERLARLAEMLASAARQERAASPQLFASWSAANPGLGRRARALFGAAGRRLPGLVAREQGSTHSQFEHLAAAFREACSSLRRGAGFWVLFADDDDLWHPRRLSEYLEAISAAGADPAVGSVAATGHAKLREEAKPRPVRPEDVDRLLLRGRGACERTDAQAFIDGSPEAKLKDLPEYFDFAVRAEWLGRFFRLTPPRMLASRFCDRRLAMCLQEGRDVGVQVRWFLPESWLYFYSRHDCDCGGASFKIDVTDADRHVAEKESGPPSGQFGETDLALLAARLRLSIEEQVVAASSLEVSPPPAERLRDCCKAALAGLRQISSLGRRATEGAAMQDWALSYAWAVASGVVASLGQS